MMIKEQFSDPFWSGNNINMSAKSMSEIKKLKDQAKKDRQMKAAAHAASQSYKCSDEMKFNLEPRQPNDDNFLSHTIKHVLGDFRNFAKIAIRTKESHLYLGLDSTVPGTPEVKDVEFDNPINGLLHNNLFTKTVGKNGTSHPQLQKVVDAVANGRSAGLLESNSKHATSHNKSKSLLKMKPPSLSMPKNAKETEIKSPNKIESILKEMTQGLAPLTDIETPGKVPGKKFAFPQAVAPKRKVAQEEKPPEESCLKIGRSLSEDEPGTPVKQTAPGKNCLQPLKEVSELPPTSVNHKRNLSTSSSSSSDDSSSGSSVSSDSDEEDSSSKVKQPKLKVKQASAVNSPLPLGFSSKIHKSGSPLNNNYLLDKNNLNVSLSTRKSEQLVQIKSEPRGISNLEFGDKSITLSNMGIKDVDLFDSDKMSLPIIGDDFDMEIEKTVSPLGNEPSLFEDLTFRASPGGDFFDHILMPSKNESELNEIKVKEELSSMESNRESQSSTESVKESQSSTKSTKESQPASVSNKDCRSTKENKKDSQTLNEKNKKEIYFDDFSNAALDNAFERSQPNPCLPKKGSRVLYRKDSTDEINKSVNKSNETKDKSKSKTTRHDTFPSVKINSGSKGHPFLTKAQLKMPPRRKSLSDSSNASTEEKSRKSKDSQKSQNKHSNEKKSKKERTSKKEKIKSKDILSSSSEIDGKPKDDSTCKITSPKFKPITNSQKSQPIPSNSINTHKYADEQHSPTNNKLVETNISTVSIVSKNIFSSIDTSFNNMNSPVKISHVEKLNAGGSSGLNTGLNPVESTSLNAGESTELNAGDISALNAGESTELNAGDISALNAGDATGLSAGDNTELMDMDIPLEEKPLILSEETVHTPVEKISMEEALDEKPSLSLVQEAHLVTTDLKQTHHNFLDPPTEPTDKVIETKESPLKVEEEELVKEDISTSTNQSSQIEEKPALLYCHTEIKSEPVDHSVEKAPLTQLKSSWSHNTASPRNCFDVIKHFDEKPHKLTIRIPLNLIKLKDDTTLRDYKNRTSVQSNINGKGTTLENHISPAPGEDEEIDVERMDSPLNRKRKLSEPSDRIKKVSHLDSDSGMDEKDEIENRSKESCEFKTPNELDPLKLVVRINLTKLRRMPVKNVCHGTSLKKDQKSPRGRPSKKCKLTSEVVIIDSVKQEVKTDDELSGTALTPAELISAPVIVKREEIECESSIPNGVHNLAVQVSEKQKKKRGRPLKEKTAISRFETKVEPKPEKRKPLEESENAEDNVCHECGMLRRDSGRDAKRLISYKKTYVSYLNTGTNRKHTADCLPDATDKAHTYVDAVLNYVHYLIGLESTGKLSTKNGIDEHMQVTSDCIRLVEYVVTRYGRKTNPSANSYDKRFLFLCLRLQSILYLKLFNVKKESAMKYSKILSEYYKQYKPVDNTGPSPYHKPSHNRGSTGTPSPSSPSPGPSPGGSVASIGSAGSSSSAGSNEKNTNGAGAFVAIPSDMYEKATQYLQFTKYLLHGHRLWEDAELLTVHCQVFLQNLSRKAGLLSMQSSMLHVADYVSAGLELIKESPHS